MNQTENKSVIQRTLEEWEDAERERRKMSAEISLVMAELEREGGRKRLAEGRLKTKIFDFNPWLPTCL